MSGPDTRVQGLVEAGQITPAEAERLRRAMRGGSGVWTIAKHPVEYLRPPLSIVLALTVVALSMLVSRLGVRFDGAFDMHRTGGSPPWSIIVLDQFVAVALSAAVFWLVGLAVARRARLRDFVLAVAVGRVPMVISGLLAVAWMPPPREMLQYIQTGQLPPRVMAASLALMPLFIWLFVWLYRGFVHSAGVTGARAVVAFAAAVVAAEAVSKVALMLVIRAWS